ncbi:MAG: 16S rRNA (cytosine(967)-C(5))-methyltransferase RsmB [Clostridiales bacterium]|jgi:16S rRNA (cytosine967-C5)-methyltransferase|nr:16S rRNA (cytosine(967)-C(5))-methyltransferase RsmB [Clostridiales bacterium]
MNKDWLAVFEALRGVYSDGAFSNMSVNEAVSRHKGCRESFVRMFAKGVIRDSIRLDHIADSLADKGIKSIKTRPLIVIRMGLYAIGSLDSVPDHAAVNEAVALAKSVAKGSDRFVNGMLRSYLRRRDEFSDDKLPAHVRLSVSKEVFGLLADQYGDEASSIAEALGEPAGLYLRTNTLRTGRDELIQKLAAEGIDASPAEGSQDAILAKGSGAVSSDLYREGLYSVQSLSSMNAVRALDPKPGETVLDMCAAPGGKTGYMAELMDNKGHITACDVYPHRLELIEAAMKRTGVSITKTRVMDGTVFDPELEGRYDRVLADVPCSGLGVMAAKPEIRLTTDPSKYDELSAVQKAILGNAIRYVRPGGRVEYSTCTLNKNENENVVKQILSQYGSSLVIIEMRTILPYNGEVGFFYCTIEKNAN